MRRPSTSTIITAIVAALVVIAFVISMVARPSRTPGFDPPNHPAAEEPAEPARPIRDAGFEDFFAPGGKVIAPGWHGTVAVDDLGELRLTSGRIVAADPGYGPDGLEPFTVTVAPGSYRVELSRLAIRYNGGGEDERAAAVRLVIGDAPVTTWEMALLPGQKKEGLPTGHYFGFGVDSGVASFLDADAVPALERLAPTEATAADGLGPIYDGLDGAIGVNAVDPQTGANVVAWYSGWGDGSYPVWFGRDASGAVVQVVADMLLL